MTNLEEKIGYTFTNKTLLITALTHSSYKNENPKESLEDNERLEFLGDSVLGLAITETLYRITPPLDEAQMAKYKAYLVSKMILAELARKIHLGSYLRLGKGEQKTGGADKEGILADAMEALIGAIFLDSSYKKAKEIIDSLMGQVIQECIQKGIVPDYKTMLQEYTQQRFGSLPEYTIVSEQGKDHDKIFIVDVIIEGKVLGRGQGHSKKEAQMEAARQALDKLKAQD